MNEVANVVDKQLEEGQNYLTEMDALRQDFESRGNFHEAQECLNRMRKYIFTQGKDLERVSQTALKHDREALQERHVLELAAFNNLWNQSMREHSVRAKEIMKEFSDKQHQEQVSHAELVREELSHKRLRFSKQVLDSRIHLDKLVQLKQYLKADEVRKNLIHAETDEIRLFDSQLAASFHKKMIAFKEQQKIEEAALRQRLSRSRAELVVQREHDLKKLQQQQTNAIMTLDQRQKVHTSKTKEYVKKQINVIHNSPTRTRNGISQIPRLLSITSNTTTTNLNNENNFDF